MRRLRICDSDRNDKADLRHCVIELKLLQQLRKQEKEKKGSIIM
jgi:hypothetical protein